MLKYVTVFIQKKINAQEACLPIGTIIQISDINSHNATSEPEPLLVTLTKHKLNII